jgi:hypothetical protein
MSASAQWVVARTVNAHRKATRIAGQVPHHLRLAAECSNGLGVQPGCIALSRFVPCFALSPRHKGCESSPSQCWVDEASVPASLHWVVRRLRAPTIRRGRHMFSALHGLGGLASGKPLLHGLRVLCGCSQGVLCCSAAHHDVLAVPCCTPQWAVATRWRYIAASTIVGV